MHWAAADGNVDEVRRQLQAGISIPEYSIQHPHTLAVAAWFDQPEVFRLLFDHGAQSESETSMCCARRSAACLKILYEKYPFGISVVTKGNVTTLHHAAIVGNIEAMKLILDWAPHIIMVASTDAGESAPIHQAILCGHIEATKLLLEREPRCLFLPNAYGQAVLHMAAQEGHMALLQMLLQDYVPIATQVLALNREPYRASLEVRLQKFAEVVPNYEHWLKQYHDVEYIDVPDNHLRTAAHHAADNGHANILNLLAHHGSDLSLRNVEGYTAHELLYREHEPTIRMGRGRCEGWVIQSGSAGPSY